MTSASSETTHAPPTVSVVIPAFNAQRTIMRAVESVTAQTFQDYEIIVVDDGSSDHTSLVLEQAGLTELKNFHLLRQENQGPAIARNTGVAKATGQYISFLDSDDCWLPHHLSRSVQVLCREPQIDWIYGPTTIKDGESGAVLTENYFDLLDFPSDLSKSSKRTPEVRQLRNTRAISFAIQKNIGAGLQTSLIRRRVFDSLSIPNFRVGEDQLLSIMALQQGVQLAYHFTPSVVYHVEQNSISAAGKSGEAAIKANIRLTNALAALPQLCTLNKSDKELLTLRIAEHYMWHIGYRYQQMGDHAQAILHYKRAIRLRPTKLQYWKTCIGCVVSKWARYFQSPKDRAIPNKP